MRLCAITIENFPLLPAVLTTLLLGMLSPTTADGQLVDNTVILSEFFEELYEVDVSAGQVSDILDSPIGGPFGQIVEVLDPDTVIVSSFRDLHSYDVATETTSLFSTLSFVPSEITRDLNGDLIAVGSGGVVRIDGTTGVETLVHDESFFSPDDAVVDQNGNIFVTEFFDSVGVVSPNGGFRQIGDFGANEFSNVDIGINGELFLASTFGGEFWTVDPVSGNGSLLVADLFSGLDDFQVDVDGNLLFSATVDSVSGIFLFDPTTGLTETIIDGSEINGGFFSGQDIDIFNPQLASTNFAAVPEPASAMLLGMVSVTLSLRRKRRSVIWK